MLTAVTNREMGTTLDTLSNTRQTLEIEPQNYFGVLRLQQEFGDAGSTAGISLTGVERDFETGSLLISESNKSAYSGGADWGLNWNGGEYRLTGDIGFSHISGSEAAIARRQNSSTRYFQRPDADHVRLDSSRTSLNGYSYSAALSRESGRHWLWDLRTWGSLRGLK